MGTTKLNHQAPANDRSRERVEFTEKGKHYLDEFDRRHTRALRKESGATSAEVGETPAARSNSRGRP